MTEHLPGDINRIRSAALNLLERDVALNDNVFTPIGAIGLAVNVSKPRDYPEEDGGSRVPARPLDQPPHLPGSISIDIPV